MATGNVTYNRRAAIIAVKRRPMYMLRVEIEGSTWYNHSKESMYLIVGFHTIKTRPATIYITGIGLCGKSHVHEFRGRLLSEWILLVLPEVILQVHDGLSICSLVSQGLYSP